MTVASIVVNYRLGQSPFNTSKSVRIILHYRSLPPPRLPLTEHMPYICPTALHLSYSVSTSSDQEADKRPTGRAPLEVVLTGHLKLKGGSLPHPSKASRTNGNSTSALHLPTCPTPVINRFEIENNVECL